MNLERLVGLAQAQCAGFGGRIGNGGNALRLGDQRIAFGCGGVVQTQRGGALRLAAEDQDQQGVALMARLGAWRQVQIGDFGNGAVRFGIQGVSQRQVVAQIQVVGLKGYGAGESRLGCSRLPTQCFGSAQPAVGSGLVQTGCGLAERGRGPLQFAQMQLGGTQAQLQFGIVRGQFQRLPVGKLCATRIPAVQSGLGEAVPGVDVGAWLQGRLLIQGAGTGRIAAAFDVLRKVHQAGMAVVRRRVAGAGRQHQAEQQWPNGIESRQTQNSLNGDAGAAGTVAITTGWPLYKPSEDRRVSAHPLSACLLTVALLLGVSGFAQAAVEPAWYGQPYGYVVIDQNLRDTLEAFGRNLGIPVVIAKKVSGKAPSNLRGASAGAFLDTLCANNGLTWFYDGGVLHVTSDEDIEIRQFTAEGFAADELEQALDELGVAGNHLAIRGGAEGGPLLVSGPPPYMAMVEQWIERRRPALEEVVARAASRERGVRVFRGSVSEVTNPTGLAQTP